MLDVRTWLAAQGLEQYAAAFAENAIDGDMLGALSMDELKELGVTALGHRKKLLAAIAALRDGTPPPASIAPSPAQAPAVAAAAAERR